MLKSLKEKVLPSVIAMILVGGFGAFVAQKVMANQLKYLEDELGKKASVESVTALSNSCSESDEDIESKLETANTTLKEQIESKASKEVQDIMLVEIRAINRKLDVVLVAEK